MTKRPTLDRTTAGRAGLLVAALLAPALGLAQVYKFVDANGVIHYTDQRPRNGENYKIIRIKCRECKWQRAVDWHQVSLDLRSFGEEILDACERYRVDEALVRAVIHAESAFRIRAVSDMGAQGLMQLMPDTQDRFGVTAPYDAAQNIDAGVRYLRLLLDLFDQDYRLASAAYNAGENAVKQHGGVPPFDQTREFVRRVEILKRRYRKALS